MTPQSPQQFAICSWSTHPKGPADLAGRLKELRLNRIQLYLAPVYQDPGTWGNQLQVALHEDPEVRTLLTRDASVGERAIHVKSTHAITAGARQIGRAHV